MEEEKKRKKKRRKERARRILPVVGHAHVEDGDHDLDAAGHGGGTQQEEDPLLVAPELPQLRHELVELHLETRCALGNWTTDLSVLQAFTPGVTEPSLTEIRKGRSSTEIQSITAENGQDFFFFLILKSFCSISTKEAMLLSEIQRRRRRPLLSHKSITVTVVGLRSLIPTPQGRKSVRIKHAEFRDHRVSQSV